MAGIFDLTEDIEQGILNATGVYLLFAAMQVELAGNQLGYFIMGSSGKFYSSITVFLLAG